MCKKLFVFLLISAIVMCTVEALNGAFGGHSLAMVRVKGKEKIWHQI